MTRQEHLLATLAEECNEVAKECMKALRFGPHDKHPELEETNAQRLRVECIHVLAMIRMCADEDLISPINCISSNSDARDFREKIERVEDYIIYAKSTGACL